MRGARLLAMTNRGLPIREDTGLSFGIAGGLMFLFVLFPFLLAATGWAFISVYALVKLIGSAPDSPNAVVLVLGMIIIVTVFLVLLGVGLHFAGRARRRA